MARKQYPWQAIAFRMIFVILLVIVTHQSLTPSPAPIFEHWSDKVLHLGAWLVLAIALGLAFPKVKPLWTPFLLLFGYSIGIEVGQLFVPGRSFAGWDIVANGAGCGIGLLMAFMRVSRPLTPENARCRNLD